MTIVLQHQFWGLVADDEGFDIELSFNKRQEHLRIAYDSLITFADPSVNFGLQFHVEMEDAPSRDSPPAASDEKGPGVLEADTPEDIADDVAGEAEGDADGDNVVTLDAFRKK